MDINNHSNLSFNNNQVNRNNLTAFPGNGVLLNVRWNNAFCEILMLLTTSLDVKTERLDNTRQNMQVFWGKLHRSLPAVTSAQLQLYMLVTQLQELFLDRFADDNHLFRCICRIKKLFYPSLRRQCVIHEKKIDFAIFERRGPRTSELDACTSSANGLPSRTGIFIGRRSNTDSSTGRPCRR